jgi:replication-associated recombination protein RarA
VGKYDLITGVRQKALRVVIYGSEGIGKTTLAAEFPSPIFIDVEDGSNQLPVARLPRPTSWAMLMDEIKAVRDGDVPSCSTLVIDTADAAEQLCIDAVCAEQSISGIESMGYGKGYYDKYLKDSKEYKIGVTFKEMVFDKIPYDDNDIPMDMVITK